MHKQLYGILVRELLDRIPNNIKTVLYLTDLLELSPESVYRRLRGDVIFSAEEILKMAIDLHVSIDDVINQSNQSQTKTDDDVFLSVLRQLSMLLIQRPQKITIALNSFHPLLLANFNNLFKFFYYQWLSRDCELSSDQSFSQLSISPELMRQQEQMAEDFQKLTCSVIFILDSNVFLSLMQDVHYFHLKRQISGEDKKLIKEEITALIDLYEQMAHTGLFGVTPLSLYISPYQSILANMGLVEINKTTNLSVFRLSTIPHTIINNKQISDLQKNEIDFLKRQSIYITQSNEMQQIEYFEQQRQHLNIL
jgi:hypothetical protein